VSLDRLYGNSVVPVRCKLEVDRRNKSGTLNADTTAGEEAGITTAIVMIIIVVVIGRNDID